MKPRLVRLAGAALLACLVTFPAQAYHQVAGGPIVVNGQELSAQQGEWLIRLYGPIAAGEYWYDDVSGLWGQSGGPGSGQI